MKQIRHVFALILWFLCAPVSADELVSNVLTNDAGAQCTGTGVVVESVERSQLSANQSLVISIPEELLRSRPNFTVLRPDMKALAFREFKEARPSAAQGRRTFYLRFAGKREMEFRFGFDSLQERRCRSGFAELRRCGK